jgi:hypothetical protein
MGVKINNGGKSMAIWERKISASINEIMAASGEEMWRRGAASRNRKSMALAAAAAAAKSAWA